MAEQKHSAGPWSYTVPAGDEYAPFVLTGDGGDPLDAGTLVGGNDEAIANARLIAAAPELLKLVEDIEASLTADDTYRLLREACRAMIATTA